MAFVLIVTKSHRRDHQWLFPRISKGLDNSWEILYLNYNRVLQKHQLLTLLEVFWCLVGQESSKMGQQKCWKWDGWPGEGPQSRRSGPLFTPPLLSFSTWAQTKMSSLKGKIQVQQLHMLRQFTVSCYTFSHAHWSAYDSHGTSFVYVWSYLAYLPSCLESAWGDWINAVTMQIQKDKA